MDKITVVGGDERLRIAVAYLKNAGYCVDTLGLYPDDSGDPGTSQAVILPVPSTRDGVHVFAPLTQREIPLKQIEENLCPGCRVFACKAKVGENCTDYSEQDSYALLNAVPTAEGAIMLAISHTPFTLWGSRVLVIGAGRVGKVLAERLKALGCTVTCSARKESDLAFCRVFGYRTVLTGELCHRPLPYDIIFNTVDALVLEDSCFKDTQCRLLMELSTKGGFHPEAARGCGIEVIKAPGLPGKVAPETAGKILAQTLCGLLEHE